MKAEANGIAINDVIDGPEGAPQVTFTTGIANDATPGTTTSPARAT